MVSEDKASNNKKFDTLCGVEQRRFWIQQHIMNEQQCQYIHHNKYQHIQTKGIKSQHSQVNIQLWWDNAKRDLGKLILRRVVYFKCKGIEVNRARERW